MSTGNTLPATQEHDPATVLLKRIENAASRTYKQTDTNGVVRRYPPAQHIVNVWASGYRRWERLHYILADNADAVRKVQGVPIPGSEFLESAECTVDMKSSFYLRRRSFTTANVYDTYSSGSDLTWHLPNGSFSLSVEPDDVPYIGVNGFINGQWFHIDGRTTDGRERLEPFLAEADRVLNALQAAETQDPPVENFPEIGW